MPKKKESHVLSTILEKIAPTIGASVLVEPVWKISGQITFKSGKRSYFRFNTLDLNPTGSAEIAKDKDYANFFMNSLGYPTVPGSKAFYSQEWANRIGAPKENIDAAYKHAQKIGFPVVVKPNSGTHGTGVTVVANKQDFYRAVRFIFKSDKVAVVQKYVRGKDYRLVVLDDEIISAYERIPLNVTGDGKLSIEGLLLKKQRDFKKRGRDTHIDFKDVRMLNKLKKCGYTLQTVLPKHEQFFLLDNANLSTGGDSKDVTQILHPAFKQLAIKLTADMGLRLCGVDIMSETDISEEPQNYWIIEINSSPGLDHYIKMGAQQEKIVEGLYTKVLKNMDK